MAEFAAEDWSLQAIVRESSGDFTKMVNIDHMDGQDSFFENLEFDRDFFTSFPEFFDIPKGFSDELEEMYKPFYPVRESLVSVKAVLDFQEQRVENLFEDEQNHLDKKIDHQLLGTNCVALKNPAYTPKYKKRKNQHKRVTIQVYADDLSSDMWAWRKYGQKPIKGSPYPRSYYRCSSSKGCLARKQVEQSCTDPGRFIITYTAEHNHSQPTRRNSLAGTVRQKFPSTKKTVKQEKMIDESNSSTTGSSKITPQHEMNFPRVKQEIKDDDIICNSVMSEFVFNDDFFSGLEDFDEFLSEEVPQFSVR